MNKRVVYNLFELVYCPRCGSPILLILPEDFDEDYPVECVSCGYRVTVKELLRGDESD